MFGWKIEEDNDIPVPVHGTVVAPKELLGIICPKFYGCLS